MNHLKFDLWTPGNGDFYGGLGALRKRISEASFPVLTANVTLGETGQPLGRPYVIDRAGPVRIAFFGLCFVRSEAREAGAANVTDPIITARELAPQLRRQAEVVVAVTHVGLLEDFRLASSVGGIDVILGGHSHVALKSGYRTKGPDGREVLICQAGDNYRFLGQVDLSLEPQDGGYRIAKAEAQLIPIEAPIRLDPTVTATMARLSAVISKPPRMAPSSR
jgi:2',3'-cyclic-nucleotide 2'-phosphodiesterase (5'-nucleotidase family)